MKKRRKVNELLHPNLIAVRLSDMQLERLDYNASILQVSRSEYIRILLMEKKIYHRVEVVADFEELKRLLIEFGKIGSNLNQIAKYFNTGGQRSLEIQEEIQRCIWKLFQLRKDVLKMVGDYTKDHWTYSVK
ncbi:plasmid mobilization protein [Claveliimonas bilis]|uniref:plasmid mobilization protein n=1 Tax=Claveliimonas bilis TaxID=3028070 RepID=UPI00292FF785|nr:plasmid mobilization relaxosome protein MobC [Claveliimonas bilis]BDZ80704.1 hypothetical protein Lac3_19130 [Claveliimonas bilis]